MTRPCPLCDIEEMDRSQAFAYGAAIGRLRAERTAEGTINELMCDRHRMPYMMAQLRVASMVKP